MSSLWGRSAARRPSLIGRPVVLLGAVAAGLAIGLAIDVMRHGGVVPWLNRHASLSADPVVVPPYEPRGSLIEVDGRDVYLDCRGAPAGESEHDSTVILEAGFASGAASWGEVLDGVAAFARVCAWDRPGIGRSESRGLHTPGEALDDLWEALGKAGEHGPFVVAGHSFGGVYARILAGQHPGEVVGLLMVDVYYPDVGLENDPSLPEGFRDAFRRSLDETAGMLQRGEDLDWAKTLDELRAAGPFEGPAILLSVDPARRPFDPDPAVQASIVAAFERSLAAMFPNGRLEIVPDTGHLIQLERPEVVIERIRELLVLGGPEGQRRP